ncbi:MAG: restriction endonuclease subunit S [Eubacterium sp.]|nr:restriction endonuclease subunit S [Eubacterium sp.]
MPYEKVGKNEPVCIADEVPFEIPESWEWVRLGDIFQHNTGKALNASNRDGNLLEYITTSNLYWNRFELDSLRKMYFTDSEIEKCTVSKGDLLVCEGGDVGRAAIWCYDHDIRIQNHIHRLRAYVEVCTEYFYYLFYLYKNVGLIGGKGIGIQGLSANALHKLLFPLPPVAEQRRIINRISEIKPYTDRYENISIIIDDLNASFPNLLKKSILQQAVMGKLVPQDENDEPASVLLERIRAEKAQLIKAGKLKKDKHESIIYRRDNSHYEKLDGVERCIDDEIPFEIPDSWEWTRLGNIGDWGSGATPSRTNSAYYSGDIPWLKTGDLNDGYIEYVPECISKLALEKTSVRLNPVGSVLIAMYGATIGKLGIASIPLTTNQACCACFPLGGLFNEYLFFFLMSQKQAFIKQSEGGAQPNISKEKIVNTLFPVPPISEQYRIVKKLRESFSLLKPM